MEPTYGFFALWYNKACEYHADEKEALEHMQRVKWAFDNSVGGKETRLYTAFEARWSTERQYFNFWELKSFENLEVLIGDLEEAGDFKFAESEHIIGLKMDDQFYQDISPDVLKDGVKYFGLYVLWNWTQVYYHASERELAELKEKLEEVNAFAEQRGVKLFGQYNCRFSSQWDRFIFALVPGYSLIDEISEKIEELGIYKYIRSRHIVGNYDTVFRFARHKQTAVEY